MTPAQLYPSKESNTLLHQSTECVTVKSNILFEGLGLSVLEPGLAAGGGEGDAEALPQHGDEPPAGDGAVPLLPHPAGQPARRSHAVRRGPLLRQTPPETQLRAVVFGHRQTGPGRPRG
jgi:hypothetical protein